MIHSTSSRGICSCLSRLHMHSSLDLADDHWWHNPLSKTITHRQAGKLWSELWTELLIVPLSVTAKIGKHWDKPLTNYLHSCCVYFILLILFSEYLLEKKRYLSHCKEKSSKCIINWGKARNLKVSIVSLIKNLGGTWICWCRAFYIQKETFKE